VVGLSEAFGVEKFSAQLLRQLGGDGSSSVKDPHEFHCACESAVWIGRRTAPGGVPLVHTTIDRCRLGGEHLLNAISNFGFSPIYQGESGREQSPRGFEALLAERACLSGTLHVGTAPGTGGPESWNQQQLQFRSGFKPCPSVGSWPQMI